jgi:putative ABC transport system ATP-binding protein
MNELLVKTRGLKKNFVTGKLEVPALRGIDFDLYAGEFVALVGPSGSGKSTLLNLIGALDSPTSGELVVMGQEISKLSREEKAELRLKNLGFVFQAYNLVPVLTALENVEFVLELQGIGAERRKIALEVLKELGLEDLAHRRPVELSGGQQQRVAVARAVVSKPRLVLADEPTANLDGTNAETLMTLMQNLRERHGMTFLFSTHDSRVMNHAKRLVTLTDGLISQ